ncbi:unnamed protein product [Paramecium octaurelia]|uniref:Uncharacterized protein n=1 Tax=Paramecium octaurelia TaxID=43137 RepID=A0A8S1X9B9_PAROT|nr:unnamed protein product [Paramecium octaurelia]
MSASLEQKISRTSSVDEKQDNILLKSKIQKLIQSKDNNNLYQLLKKNKKSRTSYKQLKYEGIIYKIGQNLCIKADRRIDYVAKLIKIVKLVDNDDEIYPLIKVQWYYRKFELENIPKPYMDYISENEVFKTNEYDYIEIESIVSLASILTYEEFDQLETMNDTTYFMRAAYVNRTFQPPIEEWATTCICQKPPNPDLKYIQCEACQGWCHLNCLNLSKEKAKKILNFICPKCQQ